jgi:hypothetical protein
VITSVYLQKDPVEGWAALLETNDFPEGYSDVPVDFVDIERMQEMLVYHGWEKDHIIVYKDGLTPDIVREGVHHLLKADENDIVLFYIASHGGYITRELQWYTVFPPLWDEIATDKRVLLIDSCFSEMYLPDSDRPYLGIASASERETAWAGIPEEGLPIIGFLFTYYFCESMTNTISVEEGFTKTVPKVQDYMKEVVYPAFHHIYPPQTYQNLYNPHPVLKDEYPGDLYLDCSTEHTASVPVLLVCAGIFLAIIIKPERDCQR